MVDMDDDRRLEVSTVHVTVWRPGQEPFDPEPLDPGNRAAEAAPPSADQTGRTVLRLKIGLAAAIAAVVAMAGALYYERHRSTEEQLAEAAVAAYTDAWNAHDLDAVKRAMAPNGTFSATDTFERSPLFTAYAGPDLDRVLGKLFNAGASLQTTSKVLISNDRPSRVSVAQRIRYKAYGVPVTEDGLSHFTLGLGPKGRLVVMQHVWWRPFEPDFPSMLWVLES
jgi:hypothetical protein